MNRTLFIVTILAAAISCAHADEAQAARKDFELKDAGPLAMTGIVTGVVPSDLTRPRAELVICDEGGEEVGFSVKTTAVIYDGNFGRLMSLTEIEAGDKIQVNYRIYKKGIYEATAVKLLPKKEAKKALESVRTKKVMPVAEEAGIK